MLNKINFLNLPSLTSAISALCLVSAASANPIMDAQNLLHNLGYNAGVVDGAYGGKTRRALEAFYKNKGGEFDGVLDANELTDLREEMDSYFLSTNTDFEFYTNESRTTGTGIMQKTTPAGSVVNNADRTCYNYQHKDIEEKKTGSGYRDPYKEQIEIKGDDRIESDWAVNSDFGWTIFKGNIPEVKSCMKRDGTGWFFDIAPTFYEGTKRAQFHPHHLIGVKAFDKWGNRFHTSGEFPLRINELSKLSMNVKFNYTFMGEGNTHLRFVLMDKKYSLAEFEKLRVGGKEIMVHIKNNHLVKERRQTGFYTGPGRSTKYLNVEGKKLFAFHRVSQCSDLKDWNDQDPNCRPFNSTSIDFPDTNQNQNGKDDYNNQTGTFDISLNVKELLDEMVSLGWINEDDIVGTIEFGNEIWNGKGVMKIEELTYDLVKK
jgi:hypothetical protein